MRKWVIIAAALVAVGIPAAYAAVPGNEEESTAQGQASDETAARACKAELESMGAAAFRKKYGTNHNQMNAFGKCVSSRSKGNDDEAKDDDEDEGEDDKGADNAAKKCKAERKDIGAEAFAKQYGTNQNLGNAFGKCVSAKSKAKAKDKDDD